MIQHLELILDGVKSYFSSSSDTLFFHS